MTRCRFQCRRGGFTLVELLAVMGIIVVLIALLAPSIGTIVRGPLLTQSSDRVVGLLNLAQQTATARNQSVEVRFYQYADSSMASETANVASSGKYRALQLFSISENGTATPLNAVETFPTGIIADSGQKLSTLLADAATLQKAADPQVSLPRAGKFYNWCKFRFRPDGTTDLPPTKPDGTVNWFITLHNILDGDSLPTPPPNYVTIQIDPINGSIAVYRP